MSWMDIFCGSFQYADDVILLSPTLMTMNKLLSICERFAVEYDAIFNSTKSKLIAYNTLKQDTSGNSIELSLWET